MFTGHCVLIRDFAFIDIHNIFGIHGIDILM